MRAILISILVGVLTFAASIFFTYLYLGRTTKQNIITNEVPTVQVVQKQTVVPPAKVAVRVPTETSTTLSAPTASAVVVNTINAPGPLRLPIQSTAPSSSLLSASGVITLTNVERAQNGGLPALTENQILDYDAQLKMNDMFAKQYFEHVSPTGVGPSDLADKVGYSYIIIGENLALGDFLSNQDLLTAWMNSPGHRANILNPHYQEIGVAVGKGMYDGHDTWLAVQSFGTPRSACPIIDAQLKSQIDANNVTIANLKAELDAKKAQIDATFASDPSYNTYVNEYNAIVPQYNGLVETNKINVANYNNEVHAFNDCISIMSTPSATTTASTSL